MNFSLAKFTHNPTPDFTVISAEMFSHTKLHYKNSPSHTTKANLKL